MIKRLDAEGMASLGYIFVILSLTLLLMMILSRLDRKIEDEGPVTKAQKQRHDRERREMFMAESRTFQSDIRVKCATGEAERQKILDIKCLDEERLSRAPYSQSP